MKTTTSSGWLTPSLLVLVLANLVPVYGTLFLGWDVFPLLVLFWLENVVIGLLNVPKMLLATGPVGGREWQAAARKMQEDPSAGSLAAWVWGARVFVVLFFCAHYGLFTAVHGTILVHLFGPGDFGEQAVMLGPDQVAGIVEAHDLGLAVLALAASHGFSFAWNYLARGERRHTNLMRQMSAPYARVVAMHMALLAGAGLVLLVGASRAALLVFLALKITVDAWAHRRERGGKSAKGQAA